MALRSALWQSKQRADRYDQIATNLRERRRRLKGQAIRPTMAGREEQRNTVQGSARFGQPYRVEWRPTEGGGFDKVHVYSGGKVVGVGRGGTYRRLGPGRYVRPKRRVGRPDVASRFR